MGLVMWESAPVGERFTPAMATFLMLGVIIRACTGYVWVKVERSK
jgi:hypothetical protein